MGGLNGPQLGAQADDNSDVQVEGPVPLSARKFTSGGDVRRGHDLFQILEQLCSVFR